MPGYRVGPVRARNFGPFVDAAYDFSQPGLTAVEGEFVGHGCDSNGSGKSYLLDAVAWCLYGRTLRERVAKDDVVRLLFRNTGGGKLEVQRDKKGVPVRPDEGCTVEVHLVNGPKPIKVVRYQGHPTLGNRVELYVNGTPVTQGRDAMTQEAIEQVIGLDYRTFVNSVAFGAGDDVRSFFSATDSERKAIMERILSLEVYAEAEKVARGRLRAKQGELETAERRVEALKETLVSQERMLAEVVSEEDMQSKRERLAKAQRTIRQLARESKRLAVRAAKSRKNMKRLEQLAKVSERTYQDAMATFERRTAVLERKIAVAERESLSAMAEAKTTIGAVGKVVSLAGRACPTCRQTVEPKFAKRMVALADKQRCAHEAEAERVETQVLKPLHLKLKRLVEPERPSTADYDRVRERWRTRKGACDAIESRIEAAHESEVEFERELDEAKSRASKVAAEIKNTKAGIAALEKAMVGARTALLQLEFWTEGFGNAGIKSFLIEAEIPVINRIATRYACRLLGPGARVQLSATRELKGGGQREELVVHGVIPGCTVSYANASKGQKKRLDLCVLLAFRDVVSRRSAKAFEQFFADELFDGLDETGEEFVVELLRELSAQCPVILVTHSPRLKSIGDRLITVRHEDGVSNVKTARARAVA